MNEITIISSQSELINTLKSREIINLNREALKKFYQFYIESINMIPKNSVHVEIIPHLLGIKRDELSFGPYPTVSLFEAANRICSDLTLMHGCHKLFTDRKDIHYFSCCFGTVQGVDLIGYNRQGKEVIKAEVFCTSEKLFKPKVRKEVGKGCTHFIFQRIDSDSITNFIAAKNELNFYPVDINSTPTLI